MGTLKHMHTYVYVRPCFHCEMNLLRWASRGHLYGDISCDVTGVQRHTLQNPLQLKITVNPKLIHSFSTLWVRGKVTYIHTSGVGGGGGAKACPPKTYYSLCQMAQSSCVSLKIGTPPSKKIS